MARESARRLARLGGTERRARAPRRRREIACGSLSHRHEILQLMAELPRAPVATDTEALLFIDEHALMGRGIGYIDVHLLASAVLGQDVAEYKHVVLGRIARWGDASNRVFGDGKRDTSSCRRDLRAVE